MYIDIDKIIDEMEKILNSKDSFYDWIENDKSEEGWRSDAKLRDRGIELLMWHALSNWKGKLPSVETEEDAGYFMKAFRQCDVLESGHADMIMYGLLAKSKMFWILWEEQLLQNNKC